MYYDNYGIIAIGSFDNIPYNEKITYTITIYQKFRKGLIDPQTLTFGPNPLTLRTLNDDAFGIKGTEAELVLLNINNTTPLSKFYSEEDDTYKIKIEATNTVPTTKTIFWGYLMQDDSSEVLTDWGHEIKLTFTDNLGSLKYTAFNDAAKWSPTSAANVRIISPMAEAVVEGTNYSQYLGLYSQQSSGSPAVGDNVVLLDSPIGNATFTIRKIETVGAAKRLYTTDPLLPYASATTKLAYVTGTDPSARIKLADVLRICLHATNLNLDVYFGNSIKAYTISTEYTDILNNIYVDGRSFMSDENNWKDCYEVLNEIMVRFQCSIFQQDGNWYITRWNELRYHNNQIPYIIYNGYFTQINTIFYYSQNADLFETGVQETYLRPYNYFKETLNYKTNNNLLYNKDGSKPGLKINEYNTTQDGAIVTVYEYDWDGWINTFSNLNTYQPFVRIIKDSLNVEIERLNGIRFLSGPFPNFLSQGIIKSKPFDCKKGDKLKISFDFKSTSTQTFRTYTFKFQLSRGTGSMGGTDHAYISSSDNKWVIGQQNIFSYVTNGDGTTEWITINIESNEMPFDGIFTMYLSEVSENGEETLYRNLKLDYIPYVTKLSIASGHENNSRQNKIIKNNASQEIFIDDTQSNALNGTMFFNSFTNLIQNRTASGTSAWRDGVLSVGYSLGQILATQMEDWRYKLRLKVEGKILGITNSGGDWLSLHRALILSIKANKYFIFGKVSYNCKEDTIDFTLYEMWDSTETRPYGIVTNTQLSYQFKYLYK